MYHLFSFREPHGFASRPEEGVELPVGRAEEKKSVRDGEDRTAVLQCTRSETDPVGHGRSREVTRVNIARKSFFKI